MAQNETWLNHDLLNAVKVQYLDGNLFSMDNAGNLIGIKLTMDGVDYSGGGSVSANVIRADGGTVSVVGALSGNVATVVLPQAAYAVPGVVSIVVKLTVSGQVTTIAAVVANVYQSSTDSAIDPGTIIPSVQTLIAAIDAAVASIPADYSALWTSLAPAFSTSVNYTAGQYVTYNGALYRFTVDHPAGAWNSAHVTATNIGSDLNSLKSALSAIDGYSYFPSDDIPDLEYTAPNAAIYANDGMPAGTYYGVQIKMLANATISVYKYNKSTYANELLFTIDALSGTYTYWFSSPVIVADGYGLGISSNKQAYKGSYSTYKCVNVTNGEVFNGYFANRYISSKLTDVDDTVKVIDGKFYMDFPDVDLNNVSSPTQGNTSIYANLDIIPGKYLGIYIRNSATQTITVYKYNKATLETEQVDSFILSSTQTYYYHEFATPVTISDDYGLAVKCSSGILYKLSYTDPDGVPYKAQNVSNGDKFNALFMFKFLRETGNIGEIENEMQKDKEAKRFKDLTGIALGDSITAGATYIDSLKDEIGLITYTNKGVSGSCIAKQTGESVPSFAERIDSISTSGVAILTILGGTNDYNNSIPMGTIDSSDITTFYGALNHILDKALEGNRDIRIVGFTPTQRNFSSGTYAGYEPNAEGLYLKDYADAIMAVFRKYGEPCMDLFGVSGINRYTASRFTSDGLHWNSTFGARCGKEMGIFINQYLPN